MKKTKITFTKLLRFFGGLTLIQVAVALILHTNIGSDSFTVFMQGLSKVLHISIGASNCVLTAFFLIIVFWLDRSQFGIGMVLAVIFAGPILNGMTWIANRILPLNPSWWVIALEFAAGSIIVSIDFPLLKSAGIAVAPNDALYLAIVNRTGKPYALVRVCVDAVYFVFGFLCGGVIGIGTVISLIVVPPMMQFVMAHIIKQPEE